MASKRGKKNQTTQPDEFWGHLAVESVRADVELNTKIDRRAKLYRIWIRGSLVLLPISCLAVISFLPTMLEAPPEIPAQINEINSPTKSAAITAVEAWLAQKPSPLPGGRILSWDGVEVQQNPSVTVDEATGQTVEKQGLHLHRFTLVSESGSIFTTAVQVAYSEIRGSQVMSVPSLIPYAPDDSSKWPSLVSWPNLAPVSATDPMTQAAEAWAKAFTSGDPDMLRLAVGDEAENHSYIPLVQASANTVSIQDAAARPLSDGSAPELPEEVVARVSFGVIWPGAVDKESKDKAPARLVYDVLIRKANTASPVIVAWGPAGTGESLTAFGNALTDREISPDGLLGPAGDGRAEQAGGTTGDTETETDTDTGTETDSGTSGGEAVDPAKGFTGPPKESAKPTEESFDYTPEND